MESNKKIKFPYYSGNIKFTKVLGLVTLHDFILAHKEPKKPIEQLIDRIKNCKDPKEKRKLKHNLYSFTPCVVIKKNLKRKYNNILDYTGLMQIDFDKINDLQKSIELKEWIFEQPECVVSYLSPSGDVKALVKIRKARTKEHFRAIHKSISSKYEETGYFDEATKNAVLPLFLSVDKNILYRDYSEAIEWSEEDWSTVDYVELNNEPQPNFKESDFYLEKTLKILRDKINNINDNGHPQVRSAALILGSRAGAGYIDIITAKNEIERLIKNNQYLQKGINGYISTALWGISEGFKNPKYY